MRIKIGLAFAAYWLMILFHTKYLDKKIELMEMDLKAAQAKVAKGAFVLIVLN